MLIRQCSSALLSPGWGKLGLSVESRASTLILPDSGENISRLNYLLISDSSHSHFTRMVYTVKDLADFNSQLAAAGEKLVVVDFFATW